MESEKGPAEGCKLKKTIQQMTIFWQTLQIIGKPQKLFRKITRKPDLKKIVNKFSCKAIKLENIRNTSQVIWEN